MAGDVSLDDLANEGIDLGTRESTSIGGLIQERLGRVPARGDRIELAAHGLEVLSAVDRRVRRVRIIPGDRPAGPA